MSGKLALGAYHDLDWIAWDIVEAGSRVVFLAHTALKLAEGIKRQHPGLTIVGREVIDDGEQNEWLDLYNPGATGADWMRSLVARYPAVDLWCGLNETFSPGKFGRLRQQVKFETGMADVAVERGKGIVMGNWAQGTWPMRHETDVSKFVAMIASLLSHPGVKALGLHCYGGPTYEIMQASDARYHALRYRDLAKVLREKRVPCPPIILTEVGLNKGHKTARNLGLSTWKRDHEWMAWNVADDDYLWAIATFLHGTDNVREWAPFDTYPEREEVVPFVRRLNTGSTARPVEPVYSASEPKEDDMALNTGYEGQEWYEDWLREAGGANTVVRQAAALHGLGTGALQVTHERFAGLLRQLSSVEGQIELAFARLPKE